MRRDQDIELSDRCSASGQFAGHSSEVARAGLVKRNDIDEPQELVDELMKSCRTTMVGAVAQLSDGDGTDAHFRREMLQYRRTNSSLPSQRITDGVRVEHEQTAHANGSFSSLMSLDGGRSISS